MSISAVSFLELLYFFLLLTVIAVMNGSILCPNIQYISIRTPNIYLRMNIMNIAYIMAITSPSIVFYSIVILNLAILIVLEASLPLIYTLILSINPSCSSLPHSYEASARRTMYWRLEACVSCWWR